MKLELDLKPGDVRLLKLLTCVLIAVAALNFILLPGMERHADLVDQKQEEELKKEEMEDAIAAAPVLKEKIETQKQQLQDLSKDYYALMENREADTLVTGLVLDHGMFPVSLNIGETTPGIPAAYGNVQEQTADTSDTTEDTSNGDLSSEDTSAENTSADTASFSEVQYMNITEATVVLRGTETQLRTFLNDIAKNEPAVQVRSMNITEDTYLDADLQQVQQLNISCVLAIYSCDGQNGGEENLQ